MHRRRVDPRPDWQGSVESQGLIFHTRPNPYWSEDAAYIFSETEVDTLEAAANELHALCLSAAEHIVTTGDFALLGIGDEVARTVTNSWNAEDPHVYGRFDIAYDGRTPPRLLEYNADTPTSLLESSVIQWHWLEDVFPALDQFNSIHERLIERWRALNLKGRVHFAAMAESEEDVLTVEYLRDTAIQAGLDTSFIGMEDIGADPARLAFVDLEDRSIDTLFKLYPWEWMMAEEFGRLVGLTHTRFIEPPWKMLWSNKGILPVLWELFPNHPNLLPAYREPDRIDGATVRKPMLGREGANVRVAQATGVLEETPGIYGAEGYVYQAYHALPLHDGRSPVLGLWMIGDACGGMGIRESEGRITGNLSQFVPHAFE